MSSSKSTTRPRPKARPQPKLPRSFTIENIFTAVDMALKQDFGRESRSHRCSFEALSPFIPERKHREAAIALADDTVASWWRDHIPAVMMAQSMSNMFEKTVTETSNERAVLTTERQRGSRLIKKVSFRR